MTGRAAVPESVESFLASLDHPFRPGILAVRQVILAADPAIGEGIKWKAPSFRTTEYFATVHLRARDGVAVILHFGAKKRDMAAARARIADPASLLEWLADDRAMVRFRDVDEIAASREAFTSLIREWIRYV